MRNPESFAGRARVARFLIALGGFIALAWGTPALSAPLEVAPPLESSASEAAELEPMREAPRAEVFGWWRGDYEAVGSAGAWDHGYLTRFARIGVNGEVGPADLLLQLEAAGGTAALLDAQAIVELAPRAILNAGFYRAPVTREFEIAGPRISFLRRSLLVERGVMPGRLMGADLGLHTSREADDAERGGSLRLGWFEGDDDPFTRLGASLALARAAIRFDGLWASATFLEPVGAPDGDAERRLGAAIEYERTGFLARAEGALDPSGRARAGYAQLLYRFAVLPGDDPITIEPALRYGAARPDQGATEQRVSVALNVRIAGDRLKVTPNYDYTRLAGQNAHAVALQLQIGIPSS